MSPDAPRLLLVDEDPDDLQALEAALSPLGCALVRSGGEEALGGLGEGEFALAVLAAEPGGFELARRLRAAERTRALPLVFVAAAGRAPADALAAYQAGAVDCLVRPLAPELVRARVANLLELAERARAARAGEAAERARAARLQAELRTREERYRFLAEASVELASTLDVAESLRRVVRLAVPRFADFAAADLLDEGQAVLRVALAHADPVREGAAWELSRTYPPRADDPGGLAVVLRTGRSELTPAIPLPPPGDPAGLQPLMRVVVALGLRSSLVVPLTVAGRVLGALSFVMAESGRSFGEGDLALAEDLGRRAAISVENARLYAEAREANRLKDEFLSLLSHELRTPLTAILGWAQLLRAPALAEGQLARAAAVIERNALAQRQLVEDLLDVARISSRKLSVRLVDADLRAVVEAALDAVRPQAEAKGVRLLPALGRVPPVLGDPERLGQVVTNLLTNALKFTPPGGRVQVGLEAQGGEARLTVSDNGEGIAPELLPHVFERFRQGAGPGVRAHRGLGLGLSIVRHLVELHRGSVEASSDGAGRGARFEVRLPLSGEAEAQAAAPSGPVPSLAGLRVLLVEDEADAREILRAALERGGARVTTAASAEEAYSWFGLEGPSVLVSDIQLPLEDGYGLIRRLRERGERVPALALTAFAAEADRARALAAGFDRHLAKPVSPGELVRAVAELASSGH